MRAEPNASRFPRYMVGDLESVQSVSGCSLERSGEGVVAELIWLILSEAKVPLLLYAPLDARNILRYCQTGMTASLEQQALRTMAHTTFMTSRCRQHSVQPVATIPVILLFRAIRGFDAEMQYFNFEGPRPSLRCPDCLSKMGWKSMMVIMIRIPS